MVEEFDSDVVSSAFEIACSHLFRVNLSANVDVHYIMKAFEKEFLLTVQIVCVHGCDFAHLACWVQLLGPPSDAVPFDFQ